MGNPNKHGKKKKFTQEDDKILKQAVASTPSLDWREIAQKTGKYSPRQCRERWNNYLNPSLNKSKWSQDEDRILQRKYKELGTNWVKIQTYLPGRSVNSIKLRLAALRANKEEQDNIEFDYYLDLMKIENLVNHCEAIDFDFL